MRPQIILNSSISLDGRGDEEGVLFNRFNEYRIQLMRRDVDAILTTSTYVNSTNPRFQCADQDKRVKVFIVDKTAETNPKADLIATNCFDITLVVPTNVIRHRVAGLQKANQGLQVIYSGDTRVNIEDLLWRLQKEGVNKMLLEADYQTNMRMLNYRFVDDLYVLVSPVILGNKTSVFDGNVDENVNLVVEGITQYGDFVLLHYKVR